MSDTHVQTANRDKLVEDLKVVVADAEEILRATAADASEKVAEMRARIEERLVNARARLADAEAAAVAKAKAAAKATDEYVHEHPWKSVAIAAGIGFTLGLLIGRR